MKYLTLCIPNYNRPDKLKRLLLTAVGQIIKDSLEKQVEICISDDCSADNPEGLVQDIRVQYPDISIKYQRNTVNMGMDYNFLNSVLLSNSLYCWIIGNDDLPAEGGIKAVVEKLKEKNGLVDILVTPFDVADDSEKFITTIYPLNLKEDKEIEFHTEHKEEYDSLLWKVQHNSGLFGFLSNVIFKRERWDKYQTYFNDKMGSIFIQMYMNIQALEDGAFYLYSPLKIIRNYSDDAVNESVKRICDILLGLDGVVEFFYHDTLKKHLKEVIVDAYISGMVWELPESNVYKEKIRHICTEKNEIYNRFFISPEERKLFFQGKKIILFGAGNYGKKALENLEKYQANIVAVIDSDPQKEGKMIGNYRIQGTDNLSVIFDGGDTYVVIANNRSLVTMIKGLIEQKNRKTGNYYLEYI